MPETSLQAINRINDGVGREALAYPQNIADWFGRCARHVRCQVRQTSADKRGLAESTPLAPWMAAGLQALRSCRARSASPGSHEPAALLMGRPPFQSGSTALTATRATPTR